MLSEGSESVPASDKLSESGFAEFKDLHDSIPPKALPLGWNMIGFQPVLKTNNS
jgi:hypothetical protein